MGEVVNFHTDSLRAVVAGLGDPARDKRAGAYYGCQHITDEQLLNAFRSAWLAKKIVTIPAMDATRKGRNWQATADQIEAIEAEEKRLGLWGKLYDAQVKARLWGGAAILIGTGESDPSQPLEPESVGKGGIKYLTVLSRREIVAGQIDQDALSETYGKPRDYQVTGTISMATIHPSRLAVFIGAPHADPLLAQGANMGWGDSVLESVYEAMRNADGTAANIASLVFEANVDVFGMPNLSQNLSDPTYRENLLTRFSLSATAKGINRAIIRDAEETYDRKQITFASLPETMQIFLQMVSGAADIPVTRLLGQSPAGMSATGESDMKNYHDRIQSMQSIEITPAIWRLDECLIRSALGSRPPEIFYSWSPLEQMSEKELAEIGKSNADTAAVLVNTGLFTPEELRTVVTTQLVESSFYPGLDQAVADTGDEWEAELEAGKEQERLAAEAALEAAKNPKPNPMQDAAPRTLYVSRKVVNAADIIAWAKGQGFTSTLEASDLHVTITYSRTPVDWMAMGSTWEDDVKIPRGGARLIEKFDGGAVVLLFKSNMLEWRHREMVDAGATWDHPEYQPHITISYDGAPDDLSKVEPYEGEIVLGPEIFKEVNEDWKAGIKEA